MKLRFVTVKDCQSLLKIYSQYIDTPITFETTLPNEIEFASRIKNITSFYPYILCEDKGNIRNVMLINGMLNCRFILTKNLP